MSITIETNGATECVSLVGELTIFTVSEIWQSMWRLFEGTNEIEIDLQGVSEIDTSGIQLLALVKMAVEKRGRSARFVNHSKEVVDVIEMFDLASNFGDPLVLNS
ncbi:MAG: STAS domain-containing protein [Candidatus Thiodiazotropha sp.]|jgi:anti-anti-sigma factor